MRSMVSAILFVAFAAAEMAGATEVVAREENPSREQIVAKYMARVETANALVQLAAVDSNNMQKPIPQLSADTNAGAELQRLIETNPPIVPRVSVVERPTPAETQQRNPVWMILAVVAVLAASYLLQRWRSSSDPS